MLGPRQNLGYSQLHAAKKHASMRSQHSRYRKSLDSQQTNQKSQASLFTRPLHGNVNSSVNGPRSKQLKRVNSSFIPPMSYISCAVNDSQQVLHTEEVSNERSHIYEQLHRRNSQQKVTLYLRQLGRKRIESAFNSCSNRNLVKEQRQPGQQSHNRSMGSLLQQQYSSEHGYGYQHMKAVHLGQHRNSNSYTSLVQTRDRDGFTSTDFSSGYLLRNTDQALNNPTLLMSEPSIIEQNTKESDFNAI